MSVSDRLAKLEGAAESMPCPVCGHGQGDRNRTANDLRNCTTEELRTIRDILANARRRAGEVEQGA